MTRRGRVAATTVKHAWILLKADEGPSGPARPDRQIREAYGVSWSTIARVRQKLVEEGYHLNNRGQREEGTRKRRD